MGHVSFGAVVAFVTGLVVALVIIFAGVRSRKNTDSYDQKRLAELQRSTG